MREISCETITTEVARLCIEAANNINHEILTALEKAILQEEGLSKDILQQIYFNDQLAQKEQIPMCQDTGIMVVFVELGSEVHISGDLNEAIHKGVAKGYTEGYLRKSVVRSPLQRENTKDNTPAIIHLKWVLGNELKITVCPKGAGSENMSKVKMLVPADGKDGIKSFIKKTILEAGGRCCPPIIVGVGIGGNLEMAPLLAKQALLRPLSDQSDNPLEAQLERELLTEINALEVGPMGLGGKTTALAVKIKTYPCHIASLPVAVNIQCHAARHKEVIL